MHGTVARPLDVRYEDEASGGDALRREWFGLAMTEMLDPDRYDAMHPHAPIASAPPPR